MLPSLVLLLSLLQRALAAPPDTPAAASFYVPSLPGIQQDPNHPLTIYAGHLSSEYNTTRLVTDSVSPHLFFVLIKNRRIADKERIAFWFNGGPGCSSFDGLMMEIGPWRSDGNGGFKVQEGGWEEYTTMVYVDQPAGTGFSYTATDRYVHYMDEAQQQFIHFLQQFYKVFPEYKRMDTYLAGESFAGQWIPFFADALLSSIRDVPLKGIAIGNGWIDPKTQYKSYIDYSVKAGILEENSAAWKEAKEATDACSTAIEKDENSMVIDECEGLLLDVTKVRQKKVGGVDTCINIYDKYTMSLLSLVGPRSHALYMRTVIRGVGLSVGETFIVLERIPILIFAGDQDLICNHVGLETMIRDLEWNGQKGLGKVETQSWSVDSMSAGTWVESRNLTYVKIFNASHMAPYDQPHVAHDMMLRFMGVNFSAIIDGSAKIPSSLGSQAKPVLVEEADAKQPMVTPPAKTPEQSKAMWEAYYNAGSAAVVLLIVFLAVGTFVWCRLRRRRVQLPTNGAGGDDEESIPLNSSIVHENGHRRSRSDDDEPMISRKGKEKEVVFDVGSDNEFEDYRQRSS
ncbi:hypothetical protein Agabi119p4_4214 [Agaricus bisporus var. burnettii]|uniref:Pheromone-processing carboxypeptidase KEX1 n=1 Tax=Agaricus bisporus var. burnettii TaxID=192524 RepID=A0A8H7F2W8_AGABI|nr:hypothetical protein Agabi119p4_4214 [Agaricus bisporus var. burnettii]